MELKRYDQSEPFIFADFTVRELSPEAFDVGSVAEIVVPIGADRPSRTSLKTHRMYVVLAGDLEFTVVGERFRVVRGDVLHISSGEEYGFHNGGYEEGRMLLVRLPGPAKPEYA